MKRKFLLLFVVILSSIFLISAMHISFNDIRDIYYSCADSCRENKNAGLNDCQDHYKDIKEECKTNYTECKENIIKDSLSIQEYRTLRKECIEDYKECRLNSYDDKRTCRDNVYEEYKECRSECKDTVESCLENDPVCGADGNSYPNECILNWKEMDLACNGECPCQIVCLDNDDCYEDEFCYFEDGCGTEGVCKNTPDICPTVFDPVCGCDGKTYSNGCVMNLNRVSLDHMGECVSCYSDNDCDNNEFCEYEDGECLGEGTCINKPDYCLETYDPVCGCDDITYSNGCERQAAGVSLQYNGECQILPDTCEINEDCGPDKYCRYQEGICGGEGVCAEVPFLCPTNYDPVCGCDGKTYSNGCFLAMNRVSKVGNGECFG